MAESQGLIGNRDGAVRVRWQRVPARGADDCLVARLADGRELPVYSRVEPRRSAARGVVEAGLHEVSHLIVLGVGLGYHLLELAALCDVGEHPFPQCIAVEFDAELVDALRCQPALAELIDCGTLCIVGPGDKELPASDREHLWSTILSWPPTATALFVMPHLTRFHTGYTRLRAAIEDWRLANAGELGAMEVIARHAALDGSEARAWSAAVVRAWRSLDNPLHAAQWLPRKSAAPEFDNESDDAKIELAREWRAQLRAMRRVLERNRAAIDPARVHGLNDFDIAFTGVLASDLDRCGAFGWFRPAGDSGPLVLARGATSRDSKAGLRRLAFGERPEQLIALAQVDGVVGWSNVPELEWLTKLVAERPRLELGMRRGTYVFFSDPGLLRVLFHTVDLTALLDDPDVLWFVGPQLERRFSDYVRRHPMAPLPHKYFSLSGDGFPVLELDSLTATLGSERRERCATMAERVATSSAHKDPCAVDWRRVGDTSPRVMFITSRFTSVLKYVTRDLRDAFHELGCATRVVSEGSAIERIGHQAIVEAIDEFEPDVLLQVDGLRPLIDVLPPTLPFVGWIQDRLPRLFDREQIAKLGERDFMFGMWPDVVGECREAGYPEVDQLSVAASERLYASPPRKRAEFAVDVALISNIAYPGVAEIVPLVERYVDEHGYGYGAQDHYERMLTSLGRERGLRVPENERATLRHRLYVEYERWVQRSRLVRMLIDLDVDFALYGNGWDSIAEFASRARGFVRPGADLRDLYASAKICLQVNIDTNVHARVFECLLSGGTVLAQAHPGDEAPGGLGEHLALGTEVATFVGRDDLAAKLEHLIHDDGARREMSERGRRRVLAEHTYRHRAVQILDAVAERLSSDESCPNLRCDASPTDRGNHDALD